MRKTSLILALLICSSMSFGCSRLFLNYHKKKCSKKQKSYEIEQSKPTNKTPKPNKRDYYTEPAELEFYDRCP